MGVFSGTCNAAVSDEGGLLYQTSKSGDAFTLITDSIKFIEGLGDSGVIIEILPNKKRQIIDGFGGTITEATASLLVNASAPVREELMKEIFSSEGSHYSIARLPIGSNDATLGSYVYADSFDLSDFSIDEDRDDILPIIKEAMEYAGPNALRTLAVPWTAPPWMKDSTGNKEGFAGGELHEEHYATFADYVVKYVQAYEAEGVPIWAMGVLNEPHGNGKAWESMHMTGEESAVYVSQNLVPALSIAGYDSILLFGYSGNIGDRDDLFIHEMMNSIGQDDIDGIAFHTYFSTYLNYPGQLEKFHSQYPNLKIFSTENSIEYIRGDNPGEGIPGMGPTGQIDCPAYCQAIESDSRWDTQYPWFKSSHWWDWWWERNHGSWAYGVTEDWGKYAAAVSPLTEPAYRYGRAIISDLNHYATGWIDYSIILNEQGGPNHFRNWVASTIMIDTNETVHYNPTFYILRHFSKFIRPGSKIIETRTEENESTMDMSATNNISGSDRLHVTTAINPEGKIVIVVLNDEDSGVDYSINIDGKTYQGFIEADAIQTLLLDTVVIEVSSSSELSSSSKVSSSSVMSPSSSILSSSLIISSSNKIVSSPSQSSSSTMISSQQSYSQTVSSSSSSTLNVVSSNQSLPLSSSHTMKISSSIAGISSGVGIASLNDIVLVELSSATLYVPRGKTKATLYTFKGEKILTFSVSDYSGSYMMAPDVSVASRYLVVQFK